MRDSTPGSKAAHMEPWPYHDCLSMDIALGITHPLARASGYTSIASSRGTQSRRTSPKLKGYGSSSARTRLLLFKCVNI